MEFFNIKGRWNLSYLILNSFKKRSRGGYNQILFFHIGSLEPKFVKIHFRMLGLFYILKHAQIAQTRCNNFGKFSEACWNRPFFFFNFLNTGSQGFFNFFVNVLRMFNFLKKCCDCQMYYLYFTNTLKILKYAQINFFWFVQTLWNSRFNVLSV